MFYPFRFMFLLSMHVRISLHVKCVVFMRELSMYFCLPTYHQSLSVIAHDACSPLFLFVSVQDPRLFLADHPNKS